MKVTLQKNKKSTHQEKKKYEYICCSCQETMLHKYFHVSSYSGLTEQRLLTTHVKDD